ncbi:MAG TPA: hypothetical protein VFR71_03240 [Methyloceanibacter sp.]|nr:hypothetical protein [Methyloceanibacter sp.]
MLFEFGAGDQPVDRQVGLDDGERLELIGEGQDIVAACFEHAGDIDDALRIALFSTFQGD